MRRGNVILEQLPNTLLAQMLQPATNYVQEKSEQYFLSA
jgi:hypothetical protein